MPTPILTTKLYIPPARPNAVLRSRLIAQLNAGLHRKLTLISAPAGFGKTTLVSTWIASCGRPVAWLSLDEADSEPTRFLAYLVAALRTIAPTLGEGLVGVLQSPQPPPAEAILTALLNDIATLPDQGAYLQTMRRDRPYERMDITGRAGISEAQRALLTALGAVDRTRERQPVSDDSAQSIGTHTYAADDG